MRRRRGCALSANRKDNLRSLGKRLVVCVDSYVGRTVEPKALTAWRVLRIVLPVLATFSVTSTAPIGSSGCEISACSTTSTVPTIASSTAFSKSAGLA